MVSMRVAHDKQMAALLNSIKIWIETESGPIHCDFSCPDLQLLVKIRGYKKIVLERSFQEKQ